MSIKLTRAAAREIRRLVTEHGLSPASTRLRVGVQGQGPQRRYSLDLAEGEEPGDRHFESRGIYIVFPAEHLGVLNRATIDFREEPSVGLGFVFDVPSDTQVSRQTGDRREPPPSGDGVRAALRQVIDPEVGVNVVDLGLIYGVGIDGRDVRITMTMTTPACPMSGMIRRDVQERVRESCPGADTIEVELVWEPRWTADMISGEGKLQLGWSP